VLAGFPDGRADEGPPSGEASVMGLRVAKWHGWQAPLAPYSPGTGGEKR